jgi:eukaryotic-like serine/threonine-protein kinase
MAPERIRGEGVLDARSDLFSLGVVLYEMLTGVCPFAAASPAASLAAVLETEVDPDPRIEPRVWLELRRALAKRPYERPASAQAMADGLLSAAGETESQLGDALRNAPVSVEPSSADLEEPIPTVGGHSYRVPSVPTRRRARGIAWATGLVVVATAVGVWRASAIPPTSPASTVAPGDASARSQAQPEPVPTPTSAAAEGASTAAERISSPVATPSIAAPASAPPANASPTASSPHPNRPRHARPVATTPGF